MRKDQRSLLLSAARSALFNRVLAARVEQGSWDQPLEGEVWMLDGSRSVFGPEPYTDVLAERLARFDIHPSAPFWGEGELRSADAARELELAALDDEESKALRAGLEDARLKQERARCACARRCCSISGWPMTCWNSRSRCRRAATPPLYCTSWARSKTPRRPEQGAR